MRCLAFRNLLLIKPVKGMNSLLPIFLLLSTTVFVSPTNNVESENNDVKTVLASKNIDKGKSILGAPPKLDKKETKNLGLRRETLKSLNKRSNISIITVEQLDILDLIAISG